MSLARQIKTGCAARHVLSLEFAAVVLGAVLAFLVGTRSLLGPDTASAAIAVAGVGTFAVSLAAASRRALQSVLLAMLGLGAFGAFLDIVLHMPFMWLLVGGLFLVAAITLVRFGPDLLQTIRAPRIGVGLAGFVGYYGLEILNPSGNVREGLLAFRQPATWLVAYLAVTALLANQPPERLLGFLRAMAKVLVVCGTLVALYALFQAAVGFDRLESWGLTDPNVTYIHHQRSAAGPEYINLFRPFSTLRRNESLGTFLCIDLLMCVVLMALGRRIRPTWLWMHIALVIVALLITLSLTTYALVISFSILLLITGSSRTRKRFLVLLAATCVALSVFNASSGDLVVVRLGEHLLDAEEGVGRLGVMVAWRDEILRQSLARNLFGSGICYGIDAATLDRAGALVGSLESTTGAACADDRGDLHDNWFATTYVEIGLVGLAALLAPMLAVIPTALHVRTTSPELWEVVRPIGLFAVALIPTGFVGALIVVMPIAMYYWMLMAFLDAASLSRRPQAAVVPLAGAGSP